MGVRCEEPNGESFLWPIGLSGKQNGIFRVGVGISHVSTAARSDGVACLAAARPIHALRCLPPAQLLGPRGWSMHRKTCMAG